MTDRWYNEGGYIPPAISWWVTPVEECSMKHHIHDEHDILYPDLTKIYCPGLGIRYEDD